MECNIEDCAQHVQIEAKDLDVKPEQKDIFWGCESASMGAANHRIVAHFKLDVEDHTLVSKNAQSVNEAGKQLPDTVAMSFFQGS